MQASRAASARGRPSKTSASASSRRAAAALRSRDAARRSPVASNSIRVIATGTIAASAHQPKQRIVLHAAPEAPTSLLQPPTVSIICARELMDRGNAPRDLVARLSEPPLG